MAVLNENPRAGDHIVRAPFGSDRRVASTLKSGSALVAGAVLGCIIAGAATVAVKASGANTGNGTCVIDATTPVLQRGMVGTYKLRFTSTTNMRLTDPLGRVVADIPIVATNGQTAQVATQVKALVTQGATTFAVGDGWDISVTSAAKKHVEYNPAGTDGSEVVDAILYSGVDATSGDQPCVVDESDVIVNEHLLTWKSGVTDQQKKVALAALAQKRITTVN